MKPAVQRPVMVEKRAMLFIDAQNLINGARSYGEDGLNYDVDKLVEELTGEYDLIRGYWFDSHKPGERDSKQGFYTFLQTNGFRVESVRLSGSEGSYKEKEADIRLATELIARGFNDSYDVAIVITGDKDFLRAVRYVQDQGKVVKIAAFEHTMSGDLRRTADEYICLDDISSEIEQ
ncbi:MULTISPECIES: NYN domain-containing protein [Haloferacaceae]|nr:NYN domain-containing protein [Halobellus captivus]